MSRPDPLGLAASITSTSALVLVCAGVYDLLDGVGRWAQYLALAAIIGTVAFLLAGAASSRPPRDTDVH